MRIAFLRQSCVSFLVLCLLASWAVAAPAGYNGNSQSYIFHKASCRFYDCAKCTVVFKTREAAIQAGFRPCKVCRP